MSSGGVLVMIPLSSDGALCLQYAMDASSYKAEEYANL